MGGEREGAAGGQCKEKTRRLWETSYSACEPNVNSSLRCNVVFFPGVMDPVVGASGQNI